VAENLLRARIGFELENKVSRSGVPEIFLMLGNTTSPPAPRFSR